MKPEYFEVGNVVRVAQIIGDDEPSYTITTANGKIRVPQEFNGPFTITSVNESDMDETPSEHEYEYVVSCKHDQSSTFYYEELELWRTQYKKEEI